MMNNHSPIHFRGFNMFFIGRSGSEQSKCHTNKYHDQHRLWRRWIGDNVFEPTIPDEDARPNYEGGQHLVWDIHQHPPQVFHHGTQYTRNDPDCQMDSARFDLTTGWGVLYCRRNEMECRMRRMR